ncbi:MAG TPA: peptidylprolyl isomerase [Candidatus Edwardsbacteria bacterium]|nr:peptidylprolyl isomerase [Candidatus Edwardsbacteria bacterium]
MSAKKLLITILALSLVFGAAALAQKKAAPAKPAAKLAAAGGPGEAVLANTAALCFKYQDYKAAIDAYDKLLKDYPAAKDAKDYAYFLAMAYERTGDSQKSAELYQDVVTKYKNSPASEIPHIDSLAMEGVGRCFNKNFQEYEVFLNGQPITKLELDAELEKVPAMYRAQFEGDEGRKKFLDRIIERKLLYAEAQKLNPESDPQFYQKLQDARQDQYIRYLIDKEVSGKAQPTEAELKAQYEKQIEEFRTKEQVKARQLSFKTRAEAEQAIKDLKKTPFDSVARSRSIDSYARSGGDMGLINRGQMPALDTLLFIRTKKGQLTKVTPQEPKYAVIKLEEKDKDKLHLRWIVLNGEDEATKLAATLAAAPATFDSTAAAVSVDPTRDKGGDLGFVTKNDVDEAVFKAAAKLKTKGDITAQPVKFYAKYSVFKVEDKIPAGVKKFDEVKGQLSGTLFSQKQRTNYDDLMKRIKDAAKIEYPKSDSAKADSVKQAPQSNPESAPAPASKPEPKKK